MKSRRHRLALTAVASAVALVVAACGGSDSEEGGGTPSAPPSPVPGGELTVLADAAFAGGWAAGLDPATNTTGGANITQQQAIFGGLFLIRADDDGSNARVEPNQAESYEISDDGLSLTVKLRPGIQFSDGTPFDAEAVAWNWRRDVESPCSCAPQWALAEENGIEVVDDLTIRLNFTEPNAAIVNSLPASNANWIASPTAYETLGADEFKIKPVGAGPFIVESNQLSSELVLVKNPNYFREGLPYLDRLTFKSIGGDQPAFQALQAGQAQAYEGMSTVPLIEQAMADDRFTVTLQPATSPYVVQLNTSIPPFDNKKAREAIYYATNFDEIADGLFQGQYPVSQSFTAPGGLFYHQEVPGYRTYDLERAKQLVQELGGLEIKLGTLSAYLATRVMQALETQWEEAGIVVTTENYQLSTLIQAFTGGQWQAMLQTAGAWEPGAGVGPGFRFNSNSPFTGVKDPALDQMFVDAVAATDPAERDRIYQEIGKYISDNAYAPFGLAFAPANLAIEGVHGPGLTTKIPALLVNSGVIWDEVWREGS
ncbi:MAG: ABC transporter substrate-binding protein [Frankia sp.]|nr:ABC transporter substrate-binding protein [Frankia sp.]